MELVKLYNSEIKLTRIGFGCEQLGLHNWGDVNVNDVGLAINLAIENGVNFFDTADIYGLGKSEENLGKFLRKKRKSVNIITKFGIRLHNGQKYLDSSPEWMIQALDASLKRLNTDYIDIFQLHYWDEKTDLDLIYYYLNELMISGKIRTFGFSNLALNQLHLNSKFVENADIFSFEYSIINREKESLILEQQKKKVFLAYGALGQGLLSGRYKSSKDFQCGDRRATERYVNFHGEKLQKNLKIIEGIKKISDKYSMNTAQISLRFVLDNLINSSVIVGVKNPSQISDAIKVFNFSLNQVDIEYLKRISQ
jgi:aryl-alcohol dehydrogenase-like predicted oxidoreductase